MEENYVFIQAKEINNGVQADLSAFKKKNKNLHLNRTVQQRNTTWVAG